jgi:thiol:disulfide interchange protein DsbC
MLRSWLSWLLLPTALPALAEPTGELADKLRQAIHAHDPAAQVATPERSPVRGLYLTHIDGVSGYVTADGRYFIVGDMLDLASRLNVTETQRQEKRRALLQKVAPEEAIVFGPAKPRYSVIVFTDVDCPYCRKLHGELDELEKRGIAVRYMAFPRSGPGTKA